MSTPRGWCDGSTDLEGTVRYKVFKWWLPGFSAFCRLSTEPQNARLCLSVDTVPVKKFPAIFFISNVHCPSFIQMNLAQISATLSLISLLSFHLHIWLLNCLFLRAFPTKHLFGRICVSHLPSVCYMSCVSLAFDLFTLLNVCWEFKLRSSSWRKFLHPCICFVCVFVYSNVWKSWTVVGSTVCSSCVFILDSEKCGWRRHDRRNWWSV
jgi:hypothetical protein